MGSKSYECSDRQKELVEKLYTVHESLRRQHRVISQVNESNTENAQKEWNEVWQSHIRNSQTLQEYSVAMHELATEIWDPRNGDDRLTGDVSDSSSSAELKCRIQWVVRKCSDYFLNVVIDRKLRLLDVGSCYNPFLKYEHLFDITALDLCPAPGFKDSIYQCDFLEVPVSSSSDLGIDLTLGCNKLISLPREYFDVVVFSFFLEYLPDQKQRFDSCRKAAETLSPGGILFILRPDSNGMTESNVRLIKGLKVGLALLGLKRIYYEKLKHVWCTGYMKLTSNDREEFKLSKRFQNDLEKFKFTHEYELFAIVQDFKTIKNEIEIKTRESITNEHDWQDLPFSFDDLL